MTILNERASYASDPGASLGRLFAEAPSATRTAFARDRDRIIHSTPFRRLKGKTQVFIAHEGDHYRTRLTHSLEVAQIARSLAAALSLDQDLAEVIALAHDLGHPPFGHAGEDRLKGLMEAWNGFDHNVQTFRIVTRLEHRYPAFEGLNLSWETLEGVIKHNGPISHRMDEPAWRAVREYQQVWDLRPETFASMEAQVAAVADDIAYNNHDVDDGLQAGLFGLEELAGVPLVGPILKGVQADWPDVGERMTGIETVRRMIGVMIGDILAETTRRLAEGGIETPEDVRVAGRAMVQFSDGMMQDLARLRAFLFERMYRHDRINVMRDRAARTVDDLFASYMAELDLMPKEWRARAQIGGDERRARAVCDYIAGMTDLFAFEEHRRLYGLVDEAQL
ncbi:deoxyguanosinetriphosphate triphosphohydrolase [Brevundimonas aveniformis]|uniref:deoxyguanosinetriphosphate triphosphohydrolase n=1 Tax=Brevundimonas aveniformis TaxID=370977 RepID=UPI0005547D06|nr:deoxyguanosinetriphosphate triphosphohydrolase [Brevundimonas aveniformis]